MANVPASLKRDLSARDTTPLGEGALVRYQWISMAPGIAKNWRLLVMEDGRYYHAQNTREAANDRGAVYNVPLPDEPTSTLPPAVVQDIRAKLADVDFFSQAPYVAEEGVRDGSLAIVTARRDGREHEVWYMRVDNALTDFLHEIADARGEQSSWADLLEEQITLRSKLERP